MFFQFKYHGQIHSPRGLVQCENVRIMGTCAVYIFLPDGTAQIHSVLHNCFRRAWMDLLNFKISFVNVEGFFLQCVILVIASFATALITDWAQTPELKENTTSCLLLVRGQFLILKNKFSYWFRNISKKKTFYLWIYNSRESICWY